MREPLDAYWYLVCGGRGYADRAAIHAVLRRLSFDGPGVVGILHGAAPGADTLAAEWAKTNRVSAKAVPAEWARFGKAAGPVRNQMMLDAHPGHILLVVAFPGGRGTLDMVERAYAQGLPVVRVAGLVEPWTRPTPRAVPTGTELFPDEATTPVRPYGNPQ